MASECPGWRRLSGECGLCNHIYLTTPSETLHRKRVVYGKNGTPSSSSSLPPPPLLADSGIPEVFVSADADYCLIRDLGASIGTQEDSCGAHHGWPGWVSPLFSVSPRSPRSDLRGRGGALTQREADLELLRWWQQEFDLLFLWKHVLFFVFF